MLTLAFGSSAVTLRVIPSCLVALWFGCDVALVVGFYLGWIGGPGRGRALGGSIKFTGQISPMPNWCAMNWTRQVISRKLWMGIADGRLYCDDKLIYEAEDLKGSAYLRIQFLRLEQSQNAITLTDNADMMLRHPKGQKK